jgi:hypothetical protein
MYYPGDRVPFLLSLAKADGSEAEITTAPRITILNAFDNSALDIGGAGVKTVEMFTVAGSDALYTFLWDTAGVADGPYFALVSYSANGVTVNNRLLGFVQLGDSRVRGEVSLEATAAKTIDLPAKADFLVKSDYVKPADDTSIQAILSKVASLPANVATAEAVAALAAKLGDVHDATLGTWSLNKDVSPNRLTFYRLDGSVLAEFDTPRNDHAEARTRR